MKQAAFESEDLKQSAVLFQNQLREATSCQQHTAELMKHADHAAKQIALLIGSNLELLVNHNDSSLQLTAAGRSITLVPLPGVASDARLAKPKGKVCSAVLAFGHTLDKESGALISCFRVYADGSCTDGTSKWQVSEGANGILPYLSKLVTDDLLCCEVYWPPLDELQPEMEQIPFAKVKDAQLENPCIGFECSIRRSDKSSNSTSSV